MRSFDSNRPLAARTRRLIARGFTLIELIIAVALSSLVGVLIYTVFINQTQAYRMQADMGTMQQNLRVAMEMLSRDVSMAGWGVGWDGAVWGFGGQGASMGAPPAGASPLYGLWILEDSPAATNHDAIEIMMQDPNRATWGWVTGSPMPCATASIVFHADFAGQAALYNNNGNASGRIMCYTPLLRGKPGAFLWNVAGPGAGGAVPVTLNAQSDYTSECTQSLPQRMICAPPRYVAYYIDDVADATGIGTPAQPVLYYVPDVLAANASATGGYPTPDDIPIAIGIEDMQFEVCMGGSGIDCTAASTVWTSGFDLAQTTTTWENLTAIRIHLVARTLRPDPRRTAVSAVVDPDPDDGFQLANTGTADGYHRRLARTQVLMRNATGTWQALNAGW